MIRYISPFTPVTLERTYTYRAATCLSFAGVHVVVRRRAALSSACLQRGEWVLGDGSEDRRVDLLLQHLTPVQVDPLEGQFFFLHGYIYFLILIPC